jgi:hypothetical protein
MYGLDLEGERRREAEFTDEIRRRWRPETISEWTSLFHCKILNNLLLLAGVVHFNPVPVWVAEIDLLDPIRPESNGARCALQVFVGDARLC